MIKLQNDILTYREMCDLEDKQVLQRGMNFRLNPRYSVLLMSQRSNAPYNDKIDEINGTIEYEGHDVTRKSYTHNPKFEDQPAVLPSGKLTQNGYFIQAVVQYKANGSNPEPVKIYEKIVDGVWSLKGIFDLVDYRKSFENGRDVFKFLLKLSQTNKMNETEPPANIPHTRLIPSVVKQKVWKRDQGKCQICGETENLHYDHDLPYSKGGSSLTELNVRLLCMKHNLSKSDKIE